MTDLYTHKPPSGGGSSPAPVTPNPNGLTDRGSDTHRGGFSLWASGALVVASVALIAYVISANGSTGDTGEITATTTAGSTAASQFTESDGEAAPAPESTDSLSSESTSSSETSRGDVVRLNDGSFINYISTWDREESGGTDSDRTTAVRSADGENWEPVEMTGFPPGQLVDIVQRDGELVVTVFRGEDLLSFLAVSPDGLNWIELANPEPPSAENYANYIAANDAVRLADGRYLVSGSPYSEIDYESLGIDEDAICGIGDTDPVEVQLCDGTSQTLDVAYPELGPEILWTVDPDGTNPTLVSAPGDLNPRFDGITGHDGVVSVYFADPDVVEGTIVGKTSDAVNWDMQDMPTPGELPNLDATYNGTTYRTISTPDADRIERSDDGGSTWNATAQLREGTSIKQVVAGPGGVVVVTENEIDDSGYEMDDFYSALNSIQTAISKDGYELSFDTVDSFVDTYSLTGPDGAELLNGSIDEAGHPSGDGVEILGTGVNPGMRFFDPATGQDYATFTTLEISDAITAAKTEAVAKLSPPFTVTHDGYTLEGTIPAGEWKVTSSDGTVVATFASPIFASYWGLDAPASAADEAVRSVNPLTKDVTVIDNGAPVVTFTYDSIVASLDTPSRGFAGRSQGAIYFSADQGASWQVLSPINGWVTSLAVGDDEVLLTTDTSSITPMRLPLSSN